MDKYLRNLKTVFLLTLVVITAVIWYSVLYFESKQNLVVTFFDVGQGDAIFIEVPNGNQVLIDGGPSDRILSKLGRAMPFWDHTIDAVVLTHPDKDHIAGLVDVLARYDIGTVLWTGVVHSSAEYGEWLRLLQGKEIPVVIAERGQRVDAGRGVYLDILAPFDDWRGKTAKKLNDTGVVSRLIYGDNSVLLTGDISKSVERRLAFTTHLDSDVLKAAHHGSKTSSDEMFLEAVSPDITIIQVGAENRYGHPTQEVLDRLAAAGAHIFRNDLDGDVHIRSNGIQLDVER